MVWLAYLDISINEAHGSIHVNKTFGRMIHLGNCLLKQDSLVLKEAQFASKSAKHKPKCQFLLYVFK